jgi:hypothetical protein
MKKFTAILAVLFASGFAFAQNATAPATTFAGSADVYYKYDFSNQQSNGKTSFTSSHNSFELGMASIEASHKLGKAAVFVDLGFGNRAKEFAYNDKSNTFMIKQLNLTYEFSDKFKVTAGSFGTHIGYELLDAVDNKNYSMSYAFTNGPFFNTGIKAQYTSGKFSIMMGVTNPTDFKSALDAGSTQKTFIGQLGYAGDTGSAYFNVTSGSVNLNKGLASTQAPTFYLTNKTQFDFVATKKMNDKFLLGFNGTYAMGMHDFDSTFDGEWFSLVGYANYAVKENLSLAYRLEYFDDKDAISANAIGGNILGNTLSLNYKAGNLTIIPEIRYDNSSKGVFFNKDAVASKSNAYFLLGTTYSF